MDKSLTVIILTYNEAMHLRRALESVQTIAAEVFVIDSYSTDDTTQIAASYGAQVLQNRFVNQATQFQWALDNAPIATEWVMRLDADEVIEADLQQEISSKLAKLPSSVGGVFLKRKHIFMERWIRHGGRYPLLLLRIWRRGQARIENRWMDEHMCLLSGSSVTFNGGFADHNLNDLTFFISKHNSYATREAIEVLNQRLALFERDEGILSQNTSSQASTKRLIKEGLYNRLPFFLSSTSYFLYRYLWQLGFLDGSSGLVYHFLQGYWYRFLVGAKVLELEKAIAHLNGREEICAELSRITGFRLASSNER